MPLLWTIPTHVKYQSLWYQCGQAELHPHCGFKAFPPNIRQENILLYGSSQSVPTLWFHCQTLKQPTSSPHIHTPPCHSIMEDHILSVLIVFQGCLVIVFIVSIMVFYTVKHISGYPLVKTKTKYSTLIVTKKKTNPLLLQLIKGRVLNTLFRRWCHNFRLLKADCNVYHTVSQTLEKNNRLFPSSTYALPQACTSQLIHPNGILSAFFLCNVFCNYLFSFNVNIRHGSTNTSSHCHIMPGYSFFERSFPWRHCLDFWYAKAKWGLCSEQRT